MTYSLLSQLSESSLFPSQKSLEKYTPQEISELAYLYIITLYILYTEDKSHHFGISYAKKTTRSDFKTWRTDSTDLYVLLHALTDNKEKFHNNDEANYYRVGFSIYTNKVHKWIYSIASNHLSEQENKQLFSSLDSMLHIRNESMRAIRRLVQDWNNIKLYDKKLAVTRLLQFLRSRANKGDIVNDLSKLAFDKRLEIYGVDNLEESKNFLTELLGGIKGGLIGNALNEKSEMFGLNSFT